MRLAMAGDNVHYGQLLGEIATFLRADVLRQCRRFGIGRGEMEDLVQEALVAIHLKRGTWDPDRRLIPWITTILRYKAIDHLRRRTRRGMSSLDELEGIIAGDDGRAAGDAIDLKTMLASLKQPQRSIVQHLSIEGLSVRETAAAVNMSEVAVRVAFHRTLKNLSRRYASEA